MGDNSCIYCKDHSDTFRPDRVIIYGLYDPRNGNLKYIGQTISDLQQRLYKHISDKSINARTDWIKELKSLGMRPIISAIEIVYPDPKFKKSHVSCLGNIRERVLIRQYAPGLLNDKPSKLRISDHGMKP